jgi:GH24 family phage-related lysozyme (muramidase)
MPETDAISLSLGFVNINREAVSASFDAASTVAKFDELPAEAQTVIVDVAYPNGPHLLSSAPSFWSQVTSGNWNGAVNELNNWFGPGSTNSRYQGDAALLQSAISASTLPGDTTGGKCN